MLLASPPRSFALDSSEWAHLARLQGPRVVQLQHTVTIRPLSLNTLVWAGSGSSTFNGESKEIWLKVNLNFLNFSPDRWFYFFKSTADLLLMLQLNDPNLFSNRTNLWLTVNAVHVLLNQAWLLLVDLTPRFQCRLDPDTQGSWFPIWTLSTPSTSDFIWQRP